MLSIHNHPRSVVIPQELSSCVNLSVDTPPTRQGLEGWKESSRRPAGLGVLFFHLSQALVSCSR